MKANPKVQLTARAARNRLRSITTALLVAPILLAVACSSEDEPTEVDDSTSASGGAIISTGGATDSSGGAAAGGSSQSGGSPSGPVGGGENLPGSGGASEPDASGGSESEGAGGALVEASSGGNSAEGSGGAFTGTCTASEATGRNASGSGPYEVVVETNSDSGINEGTIYRPATLGGDEKFPIFVWGEGGCSQNGYSSASTMAEIASHGYFVVADGIPDGQDSRSTNGDGGPLLAYVDWAIAENDKPCSVYYQSLDTTKVAANGFSCGGLMATGTADDPRMTTWGHTSSGLFGADQNFYDSVHTPVLILTGADDDLAYENGVRDYEGIAAAVDQPIMLFVKAGAGHGGDLFSQGGGEFTQVILAWLNWWLKADETASGKGALVGASCPYCSDSSWTIASEHLPQ
jgi:hypothetical protein